MIAREMAAEIVEGALLRPDGSFAPARLEVRDGVVAAREERRERRRSSWRPGWSICR